jgi:hypothetical protein
MNIMAVDWWGEYRGINWRRSVISKGHFEDFLHGILFVALV